jgi:hypothetical protein
VKVSSIVLLTALAAGLPAAAQSPAAQAQPPTPATPATAAAPQTPPPAVPASRLFTSDAGIIFSTIKPDKVADFEMVMGRVKEALGKSQDPLRKQQALSWRVFKGLEAGPGGNIVYIFFFDPAVKSADYTITQILTEAFPNEAQDLWSKFTACFVTGQTMLNLQQTINMSPTAGTIK